MYQTNQIDTKTKTLHLMVKKEFMQIEVLDYLVLNVKDIQASCAFYAYAFSIKISTFADNRTTFCLDEN
ncbi:hypothetical protein BGI36_07875 [Snodgrassella communis]|nr:hypothetical protein BGI36_07875 [Snodgrassella communis]PIT22191.1 hypothetical protein BGI35_04995 [Snodgrassella communis]